MKELPALVKTTDFVAKIRSLGYTFKRQADRVNLWRRAGDLKYVNVPRRDWMPFAQAMSSLKQAGQTTEQVAQWVLSLSSDNQPDSVESSSEGSQKESVEE